MRNKLSICLIIGLSVFANKLFAEACTYNEALAAFSNGNQIRGISLMKMAANDGDLRATRFLINQNRRFAIESNPLTTKSKS